MQTSNTTNTTTRPILSAETPEQNDQQHHAPADDAANTSRASNGTAVAERSSPATKNAPPRVDKLPPYRVILHNDDVNAMDYVVETIMALTHHKIEAAVEITLKAHTSGLADVVVTHKERAELYCDQFKSRRLTATMEPV